MLERAIGSMRRKCLDHLTVRNQARRRHVLQRCTSFL